MTAAGAAHVSSHLEASEDGQRYAVAWTSSTAYTADPEDVPPQGELRLIFEDADFLVVEKPAYLPTENTRTIKDSVRSRLEASHGGGLSIVHRLDWETSGLLVVARTREAARALGTQFANRTVLKAYVADVLGTLPASRGEVRLPLAPDELRRPRQCVDFGRAGKPSCTRWEVMAELRHGGAQAARLRLDPETGRRHQLRMHCLAGLGCPIGGDLLYTPPTPGAAPGEERGGPPAAPGLSPSRLHLHASELGFAHPTRDGERCFYRSEPPFALQQVFDKER